jgi:hypothetical protein
VTEPAPTCRCGRTMHVEARFRVDHEAADHPGTTLQLTEARAALEAAGAWGAEVTLYVCDTCDVAEALFAYPDQAP